MVTDEFGSSADGVSVSVSGESTGVSVTGSAGVETAGSSSSIGMDIDNSMGNDIDIGMELSWSISSICPGLSVSNARRPNSRVLNPRELFSVLTFCSSIIILLLLSLRNRFGALMSCASHVVVVEMRANEKQIVMVVIDLDIVAIGLSEMRVDESAASLIVVHSR